MKKHWVNPNCQNSEPMKRTVSISACVYQFYRRINSKHKIFSQTLVDIIFSCLNFSAQIKKNKTNGKDVDETPNFSGKDPFYITNHELPEAVRIISFVYMAIIFTFSVPANLGIIFLFCNSPFVSTNFL